MNKVVLPPLPEAVHGFYATPMHGFYATPMYTANQLRARDLEVARLVLESAENACGHLAQADAVAAAIRALEVRHHE